MVKLKGKPDIGDLINKKILAPIGINQNKVGTTFPGEIILFNSALE